MKIAGWKMDEWMGLPPRLRKPPYGMKLQENGGPPPWIHRISWKIESVNGWNSLDWFVGKLKPETPIFRGKTMVFPVKILP